MLSRSAIFTDISLLKPEDSVNQGHALSSVVGQDTREFHVKNGVSFTTEKCESSVFTISVCMLVLLSH